MKKKFLNFIRSKRYKIKESIKWHKDYFFLKHSMNFHRTMRIVFTIGKIILLVFSLIYIFISSRMVIFSQNNIPSLNECFSTNYINESGVLSTQLTLTLICVSLIALISNIQNKYVYGERILDIAFPSKFASFKIVLVALFALLLLNICLMLNNYAFVYSMTVLLITIYLAIFILYRFAKVFLNQKSLHKQLFYKYYKSNLIHMKKARPIEPHVSESLRKLKVVTLKHISNKNYPELNEYMLLYFNLLKVTLFKKPKQVQEYYTEHTNFQDIIGHINEFALAMLHEGNALYGLLIYNTLLKYINFYKIVCVQEIVHTSDSFVDAFSDLKDKTQIKRYLSQLMNMTGMLLEQTYLYTTVDMSYCRLAKYENMIHYFAKRNMYEKVYDLIIDSTNLSDVEKSDLIESIRMSIINHTTHFHGQDVDDFKAKQTFHREDRSYNLDIKSEPIALFFIRLIEQNDIEHLIDYNYAWNNSDKSDKSISFALILSVLSVLNNLYKKGERKYLYDINIDTKTVKSLFKQCKLLNIKIDDININEYYKYTTANYIVDKDNINGKKVYGFNPKLVFEQPVVDMLFAYFYWKNQKDLSIEEVANTHKLIYRKGIENIIVSLYPSKNKKKAK